MHDNSFAPAHTYSIVAYDPTARQWGVAVQSHYVCVGRSVPWAEAGVGAVATQSMVDVRYGPLGLALMRAGKSAQQALDALTASDPASHTRQVAMVDAEGQVAVHTGSHCIPEAGHLAGEHYSVQANLMLRDSVWGAMAHTYEGATGDLAERMMAALEAAQAEGGDIRGKQSAALLVVGGELSGKPWDSKLYDLRVDDHQEPLRELRRLLSVARAYRLAGEASRIAADESLGQARGRLSEEKFAEARQHFDALGGNVELIFWAAVNLVSAGDVERALPLFDEVFAMEPVWRDLVPRLAEVGRLTSSPEVLSKILQPELR